MEERVVVNTPGFSPIAPYRFVYYCIGLPSCNLFILTAKLSVLMDLYLQVVALVLMLKESLLVTSLKLKHYR